MSTATGFQVDATTVDMGMEGLGHITELVSAGRLSCALWAVSCFTLVADVSAGLYQPARGPVFGGHNAAYYSVLAAILAVVAIEMATAYWLARSGAEDDNGRVHAFANGLLRFAVVLLLIMVAVGGFALTVKV